MAKKAKLLRYLSFALLLLSLLLFLSSCGIKITLYKNPSRSGRARQELINSGLSIQYKSKGGKVLYADGVETFASFLGIAEQYQYSLFVFATRGKKITIDYTAFAPTIPQWTYKVSEENEIEVRYESEVTITYENFADESINRIENFPIGPSGSSHTGKIEFTVPKDTVNGEISVKVSCKDYFNRDGKISNQSHAVIYRICINPPADEIASVATEASQNGGDVMTTVASTVVLGVMAGAGALAGAAGAAGASAAGTAGGTAAGAGGSGGGDGGGGDSPKGDNKKKKEDEEEDENSTFGMYINKDFGDTIRKGEPEVSVYARMVEIEHNGNEIDRPDLTEKITVRQGQALQLSNSSMAGNYMGALVSAPKDCADEKGSVIFTFFGEGGTFTNEVIFNIAGESYISFPEQKGYSNHMFIDVIAGDGFSYEVPFVLEDFVREADIVEFDYDESELSVDFEKLSIYEYKAIVKNNTSSLDEDVFAKPSTIEVKIHASNKSDEAENFFTIYVYPEGLSVDGRVEDNHLLVSTIENEGGGPLDPSIKPTRLAVKLAVKAEDTHGNPQAVISTEDITLGKLAATDSFTENLISVFEYEINTLREDDGIFFIEPKNSLPETTIKYFVTLPIEGKYKGETYNIDVPIRLLGEKPENPASWKIEHDKLKLSIQRYGLTAGGRAQQLMRAAEHRTAYELSMIRRAVIEEGVAYYTREAAEFTALADKLENLELVFDVIKWFGDQASSYLIAMYTSPAAEAFITPLKDYFIDFIGEAGAQYYWGEEVNFNGLAFTSSVITGIENTLGNFLSGAETPTPKKIAALVSAFAMLNFTKHYYTNNETKGEWFKSLVATGSDLTANAFKILLGQKLESMLKNKAFKDQVEGWINNQVVSLSRFTDSPEVLKSVTDFVTDRAKDFSSAEVVKKYLEEAFGLVGAKIFEHVAENDFDSSNTSIQIPVGDAVIVFDAIGNIRTIANMIFGVFDKIITFIISSPPPVPKNPIYYA